MIYEGKNKNIQFKIDAEKETLWATQAQIAEAFDVTPQSITTHFRNIYRDGELEEARTCKENLQVRKEGAREVTRRVKMYNLDAIISVGYRVNSRAATNFRIWATKVLKNYVIDGVAVNERRLKELDAKKLAEIEGTLSIVKRIMTQNELNADEATGVLEVIAKYAPSFRALKEYDEGHISLRKTKVAQKMLSESDCLRMIGELRKSVKGDELFGRPRGGAFSASLMAVSQTFNDRDVYQTVAEKAANLLYLVIKDHPFYDGNKRIAALLFIMFLTVNDFHLSGNGETKISDRALTALALLIAESDPHEKRLIVALICKMLEE